MDLYQCNRDELLEVLGTSNTVRYKVYSNKFVTVNKNDMNDIVMSSSDNIKWFHKNKNGVDYVASIERYDQ